MVRRNLIISIIIAALLLLKPECLANTVISTKPIESTIIGSPTINQEQLYEWVFAVYLDADNNLEDCGIDDFLEMSSVGSTSNVIILVLFDRCSKYDTSYDNWTYACIFKVDKNELPYSSNADEIWGEVNMGSPDTLFRFINYTVKNYPAKKYALILWDHGGGYFGACWDEDNGNDRLTVSEIRQALMEARQQLGIKFSILGFDACLMGCIEIIYALRDLADIAVFSQEYEPGDGWPYDSILSYLTSNPSASPADLARRIVSYYISFYSSPLYRDLNATLSAINVTHVTRFAFAALNRVVGYMLRYYNSLSSDIQYAVDNAEKFYYTFQKDLKHFLIILRDRTPDTTFKSLLNDAIGTINCSVIAYGNLDYHPNAYGLSAYIDYTYDLIQYGYTNLDSSVHHQWDEFASKLLGYAPNIWFYDIKFFGEDTDSDGYYDSNLKIEIDLDSSTSESVYVKIYGYCGESEVLVGQSESFTVSGATSVDARNISISVTLGGEYSFRIEVWSSSQLKNQFYYYCDRDIIDVPLVQDTKPPVIKILSPSNNSEVGSLSFTLKLTLEDNAGLSHVEIYVNNSLYKNYTFLPGQTNVSIQFSITVPKYGLYKITIIVYDRGQNTATSTIFVKTIDVKPPILKILNPKNNSAIRKLSFILQLVVEDDSEVSHIEVFLNGTLYENYTALPGQNNVTVSFNITLAQYGSYEIIIKAYDRNLNRSTSTVFVEAVGPNVRAFIIGIGVLVLLAIACLAIIIAKRK